MDLYLHAYICACQYILVPVREAARPALTRSQAVSVAFLGLQSFENVIAVLRETKKRLGEILSGTMNAFPFRSLLYLRSHFAEMFAAFEFLDRGSLELVTKHLEGTRDPLSAPNKFYVVIETQGSNAEHDAAVCAAGIEQPYFTCTHTLSLLHTQPLSLMILLLS
jgi:hypothetical protein